jgi:glycosyltransferase involved in cell wall biosynthesis
MRVLRVISSMNPKFGGPSQGIRNSIKELSVLGHINEVLCLDNPNEDFIKKDSFKVHAIGSGYSPWQYNKHLIPWVVKNLFKYDVVIIHGLWLYHGYATVKSFSKFKLKNLDQKIPKLYLMPHGMLDPWFQEAENRQLKAFRNLIYWKFIEKKIVNYVDGLLFTCQQELLLARNTFKGYFPKQEINVGYGVAEPPIYTIQQQKSFHLKAKSLPEKAKYFLFLSRINFKKGVDFLILAYLKVLEDNLNINDVPFLVIAGPGINSLFGKRILSLIKSNPILKDRIIFTGMLTDNAKWGAIYGCEAFILPSHQENFGIAVVEALACSKPVLITNQVNIWSEILESNAGIVENVGLEGTVKMLDNFIKTPKLDRDKMGSNAKKAYLKYFDISKTVHNLIDAISN